MHALSTRILTLLTVWLFLLVVPVHGAEKLANFSFTDAKGQSHKLSDYKGRWLVINYWASYCAPCHREMPSFVRFAKDNPGISILGFNMGGDSLAGIVEFADRYSVGFPLIPAQASTKSALMEYNELMLPTTFFINPRGELVDMVIGEIDYRGLDKRLNPEKYHTTDAAELR